MRTRERAFHALIVVAVALGTPLATGAQEAASKGERAESKRRPPAEIHEARRRAEKKLTGRSIADRIMTQLREDPLIPLDDIGVVVVDGDVTLSGTIPSLHARQRAERLAERVRGVKQVRNKLVVKPERPYSDRQVEVYVGHALASDPATDDLDIEAGVNKGVVSLKGTVSSAAERELAKEVASEVFGARDVVVSGLEVVRPEDAPDAGEIERDIRQALQWDARVDAGDIDVTVKDGVAVLNGTVSSAAALRHAIDDARVRGVTEVNAERLSVMPDKERRVAPEALAADEPPLTVARPSVPPLKTKLDVALVDNAERRLRNHPRLDAADIDVEADDGVLTLRGTVDSVKARRAATEVARNLYGVRVVRNRLRVDPTVGVSQLEKTAGAPAPPPSAADLPLAPPRDSEVADAVERGLRGDPYLSERKIEVDVIDGEVYLDGTVASVFERMRADNLAARTLGVVDIHNELDVRGDARTSMTPLGLDDAPYLYEWYTAPPAGREKSDQQIKTALDDQLFWSPIVDAGDVRANVDDGFVRLEGTVDSWEEHDAATRGAYAAGAVWVENRLAVEGG